MDINDVTRLAPQSRAASRTHDKTTNGRAAGQAQAGTAAVPQPLRDASQPRDISRSLQFSLDLAQGRTVINVVDKETQEVIRQIPSDPVFRLTRPQPPASGGLISEKA